MARPGTVTAHTQITAAKTNEIVGDMVSMSDNAAQTIQSAITHTGVVTCDGGLAVTVGQVFRVGDVFSSNIKAIQVGSVSVAAGPAGTTFAHNLTGTPIVVGMAYASQPYKVSGWADATNIYLFHDAGDTLTVIYFAFIKA